MNIDKKLVRRKGSRCEKWDGMKRYYGREDLIPLWIADMDFQVAEPIGQAIDRRTNHKVFGYGICDDNYYQAIIDWMDRRHSYKVERDEILYTNGVISGISFALEALTQPGDKVIIQTPVYDPFYSVIRDNGCQVLENQLVYREGSYQIDFEDFERKAKEAKVFLLCSPHNPLGRVWTREELERLGRICLENRVLVISDEIHSEIIFKGQEHTVFSNVNKELEDISIICTSPTKAFNIAGLQVSNLIVKNKDHREKIEKVIGRFHFVRPSIYGVEALIAAYNESEDWLEETTSYIEENRLFLENYLDKNLEGISLSKAEGTYLAWINFNGLKMTADELRNFLIEKARVATIDGRVFGQEGYGFQRLNLACHRDTLKEALDRIRDNL